MNRHRLLLAPRLEAQIPSHAAHATSTTHRWVFRPGRTAHEAVAQAQQYIAVGCNWWVDLDLEKFFDRIGPDKLMGQIARRAADKRLLQLIRTLERRGHRFVRYADNSNIYVRSQRAGQRVMDTVSDSLPASSS